MYQTIFLLHISLIVIFQAPSKDAVSKTCHEAFLYSDRRNVPQAVLTQIASLYEIDQKTAKEVGVGWDMLPSGAQGHHVHTGLDEEIFWV